MEKPPTRMPRARLAAVRAGAVPGRLGTGPRSSAEPGPGADQKVRGRSLHHVGVYGGHAPAMLRAVTGTSWRTKGFDWLSRDPTGSTVGRGSDCCGNVFAGGSLWTLIDGLKHILGLDDRGSRSRIPVHLIAGTMDPVGARRSGRGAGRQAVPQGGAGVGDDTTTTVPTAPGLLSETSPRRGSRPA